MASAEHVVFTSSRRSLNGTVFAPDGGDDAGRALVFVHGLDSSAASYARRAAVICDNVAIRCLTFDLSGHGRDAANAARYSVYDHLEDTVAAYDFLQSTAAEAYPRIGACGASYGGYLAALLSSRRRVHGLVLRAPAVAEDVKFPDPQTVAVPAHLVAGSTGFDSLAALSRFIGPVVVVESECDERIPHSQIEAYLAACPAATPVLIAGARHALSNPVWDDVFIDAIIRWSRDL